MKKIAESFCTGCEWHGDGTGLTDCPICGEPITSLDVGADIEDEEDEEYPVELINEEEKEDDIP